MSMLPFPESVGSFSAAQFPKQAAPPTGLGESCLFADAEGNPVWLSPQGMKNGHQEITQGTYEVSAGDRKLAVRRAGAVSLFLPESYPEGTELLIWDAGGSAGTPGQEITVQPPATQQINSLGKGMSWTLNKADSRVSLIRTGSRWNAV